MITMSWLDSFYLEHIRTMHRHDLHIWRWYESDQWRYEAIERELERRDRLARLVLTGES